VQGVLYVWTLRFGAVAPQSGGNHTSIRLLVVGPFGKPESGPRGRGWEGEMAGLAWVSGLGASVVGHVYFTPATWFAGPMTLGRTDGRSDLTATRSMQRPDDKFFDGSRRGSESPSSTTPVHPPLATFLLTRFVLSSGMPVAKPRRTPAPLIQSPPWTAIKVDRCAALSPSR
jgi:hypothetical protein